MKAAIGVAVCAWLLTGFTAHLAACTITRLCSHNGVETRSTFVVLVTHAGKPLAGARVKVSRSDEDLSWFEGISSGSGEVQFEGLSAGNYDLSIDKLGILGVDKCFHVSKRATPLKAKRMLQYALGDDAPETRRVAGRVTYSEIRIEEDGQRAEIRPKESKLALQNLVGEEPYGTKIEEDGSFDFGEIPEGTYVLRADSEYGLGREYPPGVLLLRVNPNASKATVKLKRTFGGGDCNGTLQLSDDSESSRQAANVRDADSPAGGFALVQFFLLSVMRPDLPLV